MPLKLSLLRKKKKRAKGDGDDVSVASGASCATVEDGEHNIRGLAAVALAPGARGRSPSTLVTMGRPRRS